MSRPFVVTVASEKGGVGKTTIATNLAVYLKALREDLPVTIASFDNHFSVDQMFALGPRPGQGVAELLGDDEIPELAALGQYGVQYLASAKRLKEPAHPAAWLKQRLCDVLPDGVLILDTRPILDWFTEAALLAADLALVPIKDRAALVNAASLRQVLLDAGRAEALWLLPSLVDTRARLNAEVKVHEFLTYAAKERDYQVIDVKISKSPKVEGLASGFSSAIKPVLTHARNTAVHGQFKTLAEFVLQRSDLHSTGCQKIETGCSQRGRKDQRNVSACPVCDEPSETTKGHFYFDLGSRRRGFIHPQCMAVVSEMLGVDDHDNKNAFTALNLSGPGLVAPDLHLSRHCFTADGELVDSEVVALGEDEKLQQVLRAIISRPLDEAYRELVVVSALACSRRDPCWQEIYRNFMVNRRKLTRELRETGLY